MQPVPDTATQAPAIPPLPRGIDPETYRFFAEMVDNRISAAINAATPALEEKKKTYWQKVGTYAVVGVAAAGIGVGGTLIIQRIRRGPSMG